MCTPIDIDFCVCVFLVVKLGGEVDAELDAELVRPARLVSNAFLYTTLVPRHFLQGLIV